jgi:hypothetical protein
MEAVQTSETLVNIYQSTRRYNPEDSHIRTYRRENLRSYSLLFRLSYSSCVDVLHTNRVQDSISMMAPNVLNTVLKVTLEIMWRVIHFIVRWIYVFRFYVLIMCCTETVLQTAWRHSFSELYISLRTREYAGSKYRCLRVSMLSRKWIKEFTKCERSARHRLRSCKVRKAVRK